MKYLTFIISLFTIVIMINACGNFQRLITTYTGNLTYKCSRSGVEYVQSDSGLTRHDDRNGNPIPCQN